MVRDFFSSPHCGILQDSLLEFLIMGARVEDVNECLHVCERVLIDQGVRFPGGKFTGGCDLPYEGVGN